MFVDYEYYSGSFAGSLVPAEEFDALERMAERLLGYISQKRYLSVTKEETVTSVKNALCGAIEAAYELNQPYADIPAGVTSETTDGHSVSFVHVDPSKKLQQSRKAMYDIFTQELYYTGLLYQGVNGYDDES